MERFSDAIKAEFPELNLIGIEERIEQLSAVRVGSHDGYALSPGSMMPAMVHDLIHCGLWRVLELADAAIREINARHPTAMCVLVRAALETACLAQDSALKVKAAVETKDTAQLDDLEVHLKRAIIGGGSKEFRVSDVDALRIGKVIDRVSDDMLGIPKGMYNMVSEIAHPNYHGMLATYMEVGKPAGITEFVSCRTGRMEVWIGTSAGIIGTAVDIQQLALLAYADFRKALVLVSEKRNYERGRWPEDLEYPVDRTKRH